MNTAVEKRPISVAKSLERSLKEMKDIRSGKSKGKSWKDLYKELKNED